MARCDECGKELEIGDFPFCPHGRPFYEHHPFIGFWDNNIAEQPVYIESDRQREKLMRAGGLAVREREHIDDLNHRRHTKGLPPIKE